MARLTSRSRYSLLALCLLLLPVYNGQAAEARLKDMATLEGLSREPLLGYGLVVGLAGTGDGQSAAYTVNSLTAMLERLGVTVDASQLKMKNVAAVLVTAQLMLAAAEGSRLDVTVSSMGDATSLEGGFLIMTPLKAVDGRVCALAQGSVSIGGFNVRGGGNNRIRKNHSTVGTIPNGAKVTLENRQLPINDGNLTWLLHNPDFGTASHVATAINGFFGEDLALAASAQRIEVRVPPQFLETPVNFIAQMGELRAATDMAARVVINERTGTIIMGHGVVLNEAAVAHGNLKVVIKTWFDVSQPPPNWGGQGRTVVTPDIQTDVEDQQAQVLHVPDTSTVADVVSVLNEIGASPRDIIAILEALKQAGSLQAELVVM